ncbi:MAG: hypothetical protein Kow0099_21270 [Candidatus Abyssubacteria bacterium]
MGREKFLVWVMVILFLAFSSAYTIMGYGSLYDPDEGEGGLYRFDRGQSIRVARAVLSGDFGVYEREMRTEFLSETGRTRTYPPGSSLLVAPFVCVADKLQFPNDVLFSLATIPFIFLSGFGVALIVSIIEKFQMRDITKAELVLIGVFLFGGLLFYCCVKEGKFEGVVAFFTLAGIWFLPDRKLLSGICFGAALCTKQSAILAVAPTFLVLVGEKKFGNLIYWSLGLCTTVLCLFLPFVIGSGLNNVYMGIMRTFDFCRIQESTSVGYLYELIRLIFGDTNGVIETRMQYHANKVVLLICLLFSVALVINKRVSLSKPASYFALLTVCGFLYVIFGKWYHAGIYEIVPLYLFVLWALAAKQSEFATLILLVASFLVGAWPMALGKKELLLLLYSLLSIYVFHYILTTRDGETEPVD